jgi:hypothetical protein
MPTSSRWLAFDPLVLGLPIIANVIVFSCNGVYTG